MKLTDIELRRLRLDPPRRFESSFVEKFGESLARERFNSIIDELLAARRVVEASRQHLLAAVSPQRIIDSIIDYDKTVTR
jgi:hypothetical protein